ncbi:flippase-like domain-containing protein [Actinophytocola gossypii]|uniref:Flippase-like domain-containing protein n=1 Tax=Actinophytocola gossypii TaxID=2812003 RepID=A0ABT2J8J3_9PSEU|nr:flippase-like domain-containing protein [Actinophytocola gossypii]MCT2584021.1 flippase-like domain-containing protein [Actinophytocola gossypii]
MLAFGAAVVVGRWGELRVALERPSWGLVVAAGVPAAGGILLTALGWRTMLADLGAPLPARVAGRVYLLGQLGKYLPGSVWSFVAQAELARDHAVSRRVTVTGGVLGLLLAVGTGVVTAFVALPLGGGSGALVAYWWVVLVVPAGLVLLHPRVIGPLLDRVLRLLRREPLVRRPSYRGMVTAAGWYALSWLLLGLHCWLLMLGFGAPAGTSLPVAVGGLTLAFCLGLIVVPAPAGAGVREVALVLAFAPVLGPGASLAVALISRIMLTVLDFVLAGAVWAERRPRLRARGRTKGLRP